MGPGGTGAAGTVTVVETIAPGPPLRSIVWPVNTCVVEVPTELVTVTLAV